MAKVKLFDDDNKIIGLQEMSGGASIPTIIEITLDDYDPDNAHVITNETIKNAILDNIATYHGFNNLFLKIQGFEDDWAVVQGGKVIYPPVNVGSSAVVLGDDGNSGFYVKINFEGTIDIYELLGINE